MKKNNLIQAWPFHSPLSSAFVGAIPRDCKATNNKQKATKLCFNFKTIAASSAKPLAQIVEAASSRFAVTQNKNKTSKRNISC
jgi:hypothetical protein